MRDDRFQRRHHRVFLHHVARGGDVLLKRVRARAAPVLEDFVDRTRIDVAGRGDATLAAVLHVVEQEYLAAGKYVEARFCEGVQHRLGVVPIAGGVLHSGHCAREILQQPLYQAERDRHLRDRRNVIQIELQARVADALDHLGEIPVQAFVGHALVVEGRKHEHAGTAERRRVRGEPHRVRERAAARARHKRVGRHAFLNQRLQQHHAFFHGERVRLAVGTEHGEPAAAVREQPFAVAHVALTIWGEVALEGRHHRGEDARESLRSSHGRGIERRIGRQLSHRIGVSAAGD